MIAKQIARSLLQAGHVVKFGEATPNRQQLLSIYDYGSKDNYMSVLVYEKRVIVNMIGQWHVAKKVFDPTDFEGIANTYSELHEKLLDFKICAWHQWQKDREYARSADQQQVITEMLTLNKPQLLNYISECIFSYFRPGILKERLNFVFAVAERLDISRKELNKKFKALRKVYTASCRLSA